MRRYGAVSALIEFSVWLPVPVLILHMTDRGLDLGVIGLMFAIRSILVVLLELPSGGLADAIGRKPVAMLAQLFTLASFIAILFVGGPGLLFVYTLLQGVGSALHSGALDAWFVESLNRAEQGADVQKALAGITAVQAVAMLAGAALGGWLPAAFSGFSLPWPMSAFGITIMASIAFRLAALAATQALVREPARSEGETAASVPLIVRDAISLITRLRPVPWLLAASLTSGVALISLETFWQPVAALTFGGAAEDSAAFGMLGTMMGAAILVGSLAVSRWGGRFPGGPVWLALVSQVLKGLSMLGLTLSLGPAGLAVFLMLAYASTAGNNAPHDAMLHKAVPDSRRSVMLSLNSLAFFLGTAIGSSVLGALAGSSGPALALAVGGFVTLAGSLFYLGLRRQPAVSAESGGTGIEQGSQV